MNSASYHYWILSVICFSILKTVKGQQDQQQSSGAFAQLDQLRGRTALSAAEIRTLVANAKPNVTYPAYKTIPKTSFTCNNVKQAGFYADPDTGCQAYRRCEPGMAMASYLCPAGTIWNNIALTCDYWWNVQCSKSAQFFDYSNPRIYRGPNVRLLDDNGNGGGSGSSAGGSSVLSGSYATVNLESAYSNSNSDSYASDQEQDSSQL
ncbi:uncharacterized protein LOC129599466 [Paramacrobiotus metropolitanus]|uniref:uncharacterized protein LOC129599466 n=1 Tax=Paramacrobiotus metropolitanus TaxID=2943436 RepID=UPI00244604E9|nr:uncharacterized protein LOC129599466 [Paramacrobiotus metropolitanus]